MNRDKVNMGHAAGYGRIGGAGQVEACDLRANKVTDSGLSDVGKAKQVLAGEKEHEMMQSRGIQLLHNLRAVYGSTQDQISDELHAWFRHQGFWPENWNPSHAFQATRREGGDEPTVTIPFSEYVRLKKMEKLGLIVTEVAETMEAVRKNDVDNELEELADIDVRMHDYKGGFGYTFLQQGPFSERTAPEGFLRKMLKNFERPFRHGKKF